MAPSDRAKPSAPSPCLVRARDAASMLAICPRKLWELTKGGKLSCIRIEKSVRYDVEDLRKFIEKRRGGGAG